MLLINPTYRDYGGILKRYTPLSLPMSIGYLAGQMLSQGYDVRIYDEELRRIDESNIEDLIRGLPKPYVFGISILTSQASRAYELSVFLKSRYPDSIVIVGGYHPTALPEEALSFDTIDFVVRGEGERTIVVLYDAIRNRNKDFSNINGISFRVNGEVKHMSDMPLITDLDTIPEFPYYLYTDLIKRVESERKYEWGFIISSRGCPYKCTYCSQRTMTGATYRYNSIGRILKELDILINQLGAKQIYFFDDNMTVNRKRVTELCGAIYNSKLWEKCRFSMQTRADNFHKDIVPKLKSAGFEAVGIGMEVGSDRLATLIQKGQTVRQQLEAVKLAKAHDMDVHLFMMFGFPTETSRDRYEAFKMVKKLNPTLVKFNNLMPLPGTPIYQSLIDSGRMNIKGYWENFTSTLSELGVSFTKRQPLPYVPETTSEWELIRDIIRYNFLVFVRLDVIFDFFKSKLGAGMLKLDSDWSKHPREYYYLFKIGTKILMNFLVVMLPLWVTEPIMQLLIPRLQKRIPEENRTVFLPRSWSKEYRNK